MKFKELTTDIIEQARVIYWDSETPWDERMEKLKKLFGKGERTTRKWCSEKLKFKRDMSKGVSDPDQYKTAKSRVFDDKKKYYLVTWA